MQSGYAADTGQAFGTQSNGATYGWTNPVAEVDTLTPGGTITAGDIDSINLPNGAGQVQFTVVAGSTTAAAVAEGLTDAWNANLAAAAIGSATTTANGTLTITAAKAGHSLGLTSSVAGTGTLTTAITTAASNNAAANTSGTYDRTGNTSAPYNSLSTQTGIILNPGNVWNYQLPNGVYDVHIVAADSSTSDLVDNLSVNGTTLHATSFSASGGTFQQFYATVTVTNGLLCVTGGPGMVLSVGGVPTTQGRLSSIQINKLGITTATTVTSNIASPAEGQPVTFTAAVTPASGSGETGTVQFVIDGANAGGPVTISNSNGTATYTTSSLAGGSHSVVAIYSGDANFAGSTSSTFTQSVVYGPAAKLIFVQQPTYAHTGTGLLPAVSVAVTDSSGSTLPTNSSTVTLTLNGGTFSGGATTATATAVNGVATFTNLVITAAGTYTLTATDGTLVKAVSDVFSIGNYAYVNFNNGSTDLSSQFLQNSNPSGTAVPGGGTDLTWESNAGIDDQNGGTTAGGGLLLTTTAEEKRHLHAGDLQFGDQHPDNFRICDRCGKQLKVSAARVHHLGHCRFQ